MTREEAIEVLENPDVSIGVSARIGQDTEYWRKLKPALDMAISAIRQQECVGEVTKKAEPLTNAQKIRAMSDEDLAEFLIDLADDGNLRIREWLQQPAEEDDHDERKENENVRR